MTRVGVGLVALLALLVFGSTSAQEATGPSFTADSRTRRIELKRTVDQLPDVVEFPFRNSGNGDLILNIRSVECSCFDVSVDKQRLLPGEGGKLSLSLKSDSFLRDRRAAVALSSNDPLSPLVIFEVAITWIDAVSVSDGGIANLGRLAMHSHQTAALSLIQNFGSHPLEIRDLHASGERIKASFASGRVSAQTNSLVCNIEVHAIPPMGPFCDTVTIETNLDECPKIALHVTGIVVGAIDLTPWQLHIGPVSSGKAQTRTLRAQLSNGVNIRDLSTDVEGLRVQRESIVGGERLVFALLSQQETKGPISGNVRLFLDDDSQALLPVIGMHIPSIVPPPSSGGQEERRGRAARLGVMAQRSWVILHV